MLRNHVVAKAMVAGHQQTGIDAMEKRAPFRRKRLSGGLIVRRQTLHSVIGLEDLVRGSGVGLEIEVHDISLLFGIPKTRARGRAQVHWAVISTTELCQLRGEFRERGIEIGHETVIGDLEDRGVLVLVDGDDDLAESFMPARCWIAPEMPTAI